MSNKNNQDGFSVVLGLVVLTLAVVVGYAGWRVIAANNTSEVSTSSENIEQQAKLTEVTTTMEDSAKTFTFKTTPVFTKKPFDWNVYSSGKPGTEPDWTKESQPIELTDGGKGQILITASIINTTTADSYLAEATNNQFTTHQKVTVQGSEGVHTVLDLSSSTEFDRPVRHAYTLFKGPKAVTLTFTSKNESNSGAQNSFDVSDKLDDFEAIVQSVKFN